MRIEIPEAVEEIIGRLNRCGYEAFAVGGCVRDTLLGREPGDWDITTSASPYQVKEIFRRTIDTGIQHGTVTIMKNHVGYEVTTYRIDGEYEDGRHPKSVQFTSSLKEDLRRRDFTINAMAYSHETGIVDEFGGMEDLAAKTIRCVGNPMDRFTEDALRILRAIRFSAQLDFAIEQKTRDAIAVIAPNIAKVSKERIQVELTKLLLSDHPEKMAEVYEMGISPYVSKGFHEKAAGAHGAAQSDAVQPDTAQPGGAQNRAAHSWIRVNPALPKQKHMRWAAFLKNAGTEDAVQILKDLKLDNDTITRVRTLNQWIYRTILPEKTEIRRAMSQMEDSLFDDLLILKDSLGEPGVEELERLKGEIRRDGDCLRLKNLAVSGRDLMEAGVQPGKQVGEELARLLDAVLEEPGKNQKDVLLGMILKGR